ncbi:type II toxin-antitoxin system HicA family toxin [Methanospirillum sp.]|uniref:type II toxin-antitoxin system HicA family toxin n=1 Tax=Methanospirillum sp. TaxID=45200 RepID=UPI00359F92DF
MARAVQDLNPACRCAVYAIHLWYELRRTLVTVPNHNELALGTLLSIIRQAKMDHEEFLLYIE